MEKLRASSATAMDVALKPKDESFPRAMDVHGLFSTEPDLFGGFTDVSPWVRGDDKNADVTVFLREFDAKKRLGKTEDLTGPAFDSTEGCAVAIHHFRDFIGDWEPRLSETPPPNALRATTEPRLLGPFALAYLEALICAADIQASQTPSQIMP